MDDYEMAVMMLQKLRPSFDPDWIRAKKTLDELNKKTTKNKEQKQELFVYLVNKIYKVS